MSTDTTAPQTGPESEASDEDVVRQARPAPGWPDAIHRHAGREVEGLRRIDKRLLGRMREERFVS
jgi:hypothetical protein